MLFHHLMGRWHVQITPSTNTTCKTFDQVSSVPLEIKITARGYSKEGIPIVKSLEILP